MQAAAPNVAPAVSSAGGSGPASAYKAPQRNPALRMMGLPGLPKKLPSRNWLIFIGVTTAFSAAIIYDKREKKRATARWARAVAPLAREPISNPSQMPRRVTVYLESPPGDGLRIAQDHFVEYVKPVLAASGLDWDFVQGRQQGDVRAALAERIRRQRRLAERPDEAQLPTEENLVATIRQRNNVPEWDGVRGDIVIGRHSWKEYMRGLHEGWLGPLELPPDPAVENAEAPASTEEKKDGDKKEGEEKPKRPPQPPAYNSTIDYPTSNLPLLIPAEFPPSAPIRFPHVLGFSATFTRLGRFLNRRKLADDIGREVAAVCFAAAREWRETPDQRFEQELALEWEERDWTKSVWKEEKEPKAPEEGKLPEPPKERLWAAPMVVDPRIAMRMRRFEILPEDEARARAIVVPEEEVEGWIKGSARSLVRWAVNAWKGDQKKLAETNEADW